MIPGLSTGGGSVDLASSARSGSAYGGAKIFNIGVPASGLPGAVSPLHLAAGAVLLLVAIFAIKKMG